MSAIAAVILAGGRGERLGGVDKARLRICGLRLLDRVAAVLRAEAAPILCVTRQGGTLVEMPGLVSITDLSADFGGPLAGIAAAVHWLQAQPQPPEFLLSVAVDTPFFPKDFAAHARAVMDDGVDAVVGQYDGQFYPTNVLWRLGALATLPERVLAGTVPKSPKHLLRELQTYYLDWFPQEAENPFANVNTLKDLLILSERQRIC